MTYPLPLKILGVGRYLPDRIVLSSELERKAGLTAGWIERKQGVKERRRVALETNSEMSAAAAREALDDAGLQPADLDLILNASGTTEQAIPDGAPLIQHHLGLGESGIACFSVHTTCLSFLTAFDLSASLLATGRYRRILIASAEITSKGLNWADQETSTLFGDGAAAAVVGLTPAGEMSAVHGARFETYGSGARFTQVMGCGTSRPPNHPDTRAEDNLFHMDAEAVLLMTFRHAPQFLEHLKFAIPGGLSQLDVVIPHQASRLALDSHTRFGFKRQQIVRTLECLGNCVAASIPLTLHAAIRCGRLSRGNRALLLGTGAGLSFGGVVFTY